MTSPYRALPVVAPATRAVCIWCRHVAVPDGPYGVPKCRARARRVPDPVRGSKIVDDYRDCELVRSEENGHAHECEDFAPTIATRVLRAVGARR